MENRNRAAHDTAIVGGGISGLSTAYFLAQHGIGSILIEKSRRLGGLIKTDCIEGCELEAGPDSYIATKPAVTDLAQTLPGPAGDPLATSILGSNDARRRVLIVRDGRLVPLPKGMVMMAPAEWKPALTSPLFSARTKLRFLRETLLPPRERANDISIEQFVRDHFGGEVLEYVAEPLLSGVYGGYAGQLSAESVLPRFLDYERRYGSIVRGVRRERRDSARSGSLFLSFRGGMQTLTDSLHHAIQPACQILRAEVSGLERTPSRAWRLRAGGEDIEAINLILACPAHTAAVLLEREEHNLAAELAAIPFSSAVLVTLVYAQTELNHPLNAFGFLVPRPERRTVAAATWVGTKFPSRIPAGLAAIRAFIVEPEATTLLDVPDEELIALAQADFSRLMGLSAVPRFSTVYRWPRSMPQYVVGHQARCQRIGALLAATAGLHLVGNAYSGVGIPDCVRMAKETAKAISQGLL